jgi:hypothetical protein
VQDISFYDFFSLDGLTILNIAAQLGVFSDLKQILNYILRKDDNLVLCKSELFHQIFKALRRTCKNKENV